MDVFCEQLEMSLSLVGKMHEQYFLMTSRKSILELEFFLKWHCIYYIDIYIDRNNFSDHDIYSLQICFMRQDLNPQETNKYWYCWSTGTNKVQHRESFSGALITWPPYARPWSSVDKEWNWRGKISKSETKRDITKW